MVRLLLEQPTVDAGALDSAGRSPLDDVEAMLKQTGDAGLESRLQTVRKLLLEADLGEQMQRQKQDGVTREEVILTLTFILHDDPNPNPTSNPNLKKSGHKLNRIHNTLTLGPAGTQLPSVADTWAGERLFAEGHDLVRHRHACRPRR